MLLYLINLLLIVIEQRLNSKIFAPKVYYMRFTKSFIIVYHFEHFLSCNCYITLS